MPIVTHSNLVEGTDLEFSKAYSVVHYYAKLIFQFQLVFQQKTYFGYFLNRPHSPYFTVKAIIKKPSLIIVVLKENFRIALKWKLKFAWISTSCPSYNYSSLLSGYLTAVCHSLVSWISFLPLLCCCVWSLLVCTLLSMCVTCRNLSLLLVYIYILSILLLYYRLLYCIHRCLYRTPDCYWSIRKEQRIF